MQLPRHFLHHWLTAFEKSRLVNHRIVTSFITRLENHHRTKAEEPNSGNIPQGIGGGWRSTPDSQISALKIIRQAWKERVYLKRYCQQLDKDCIWVVADDRRSGSINDWNQLSKHLLEFGSQTPPVWLQEWRRTQKQLVVITPNLFVNRTNSQQSNTLYISYLSLLSLPLTWPLAYLRSLFKIIKNEPINGLLNRKFCIALFLAASYAVLLKRKNPEKLLMMTSNSFVIELLRYIFIASGTGRGVIEVLHGVPSLEIEDYHNEVLAFASYQLAGRLTLVPSVPQLQLSNANGRIIIETTAINLKMNAVNCQIGLLALARECVHRAKQRRACHVVTLNGAGNVEGKRFLDTGCFAAERAILDFIIDESKRLGISIHLQYSLHPAHIKSGESKKIKEVLRDSNVEVLEDSMMTWLESDLCVSLFSSASWDAHAFGCKVVFGVTPQDEFYNGEILKNFSYPHDGKTLFQIITESLELLPKLPAANPYSRIQIINGSTGLD